MKVYTYIHSIYVHIQMNLQRKLDAFLSCTHNVWVGTCMCQLSQRCVLTAVHVSTVSRQQRIADTPKKVVHEGQVHCNPEAGPKSRDVGGQRVAPKATFKALQLKNLPLSIPYAR